MKVVIGSSALRICMLVYTVFALLHRPHVNAPSGAVAAGEKREDDDDPDWPLCREAGGGPGGEGRTRCACRCREGKEEV